MPPTEYENQYYQRLRSVWIIRGDSSWGQVTACEGLSGCVKNEMFYGRNWAGMTLENLSASWSGAYAGITRSILIYHKVQ